MITTEDTGIGAFGPAYRYMLERDTHAEGSVDQVILRDMVRLDAEAAPDVYGDFTPLTIGYSFGDRPALEGVLRRCVDVGASPDGRLAAIVQFVRELGAHADASLNAMRLGGTEEAIIERGSDWCTDVARVACALCQIAELPCRVVYLFNTDAAYSGHAIVETYYRGAWGAVDSLGGVIYQHPDGRPASVWELMNCPRLIEAHHAPDAWYTTVAQFRAAGVSNYFCWERHRYDYTVSSLNAYYRSILEMAGKGWPGGLRWLYGEDEI